VRRPVLQIGAAGFKSRARDHALSSGPGVWATNPDRGVRLFQGAPASPRALGRRRGLYPCHAGFDYRAGFPHALASGAWRPASDAGMRRFDSSRAHHRAGIM